MKIDFGKLSTYVVDTFKNNLVNLLILAAVPAVMSLLTFMGILSGFSAGDIGGAGVMAIVMGLLTIVIGIVFNIAIYNLLIKTHNGETVSNIKEALPSVSQFIFAIILSIVISVLTMIGFVLLFFPGLIVMFLLSYSLYFFLDKQEGIGAAMKGSFTLAKDNIVETIVLIVITYVLSMISSMIPFSDIVIMPLTAIVIIYFYKTLLEEKATDGTEEAVEIKEDTIKE